MFDIKCVFRFTIMGGEKKLKIFNIRHQPLSNLKIFNRQKKQGKNLLIRV